MSTTIEELVKPLFDQWLEEKLPEIRTEIRNDLGAKAQQTSFNQTEMAKKQNVSVTTFVKWRKKGLKPEPNPTGKLLFDLNKVNEWREANGCSKTI